MRYLLYIAFIFILSGCTPKQETLTQPSKMKVQGSQLQKEAPEESILEPFGYEEEHFKVAFLYPSKIMSKYAYDAINTITAYLLKSGQKFEIETFDTLDENEASIKAKVEEVLALGYKKAVFFFSKNDMDYSAIDNIDDLDIYFPILNKNSVHTSLKSAVFGGIDYAKQMEKLLEYSSGPVIEFRDESSIGIKLSNILNKHESYVMTKYVGSNINYKAMLNNRMNNATFVLNTPIVKSSILLSQFRANEIEPSVILSTQLNYNPLIFSLTQKEDRDKLIIMNSISKIESKLLESIDLLDADVRYNWVNYSTFRGIEYLLDPQKKADIVDNQMAYGYELKKVGDYAFYDFK